MLKIENIELQRTVGFSALLKVLKDKGSPRGKSVDNKPEILWVNSIGGVVSNTFNFVNWVQIPASGTLTIYVDNVVCYVDKKFLMDTVIAVQERIMEEFTSIVKARAAESHGIDLDIDNTMVLYHAAMSVYSNAYHWKERFDALKKYFGGPQGFELTVYVISSCLVYPITLKEEDMESILKIERGLL